MIECQIVQLHKAGITDIVVVGYMKEKFFYLEQKYGVQLVVNNEFGKKEIFIRFMWQENIFLIHIFAVQIIILLATSFLKTMRKIVRTVQYLIKLENFENLKLLVQMQK